jgi:hypothetical protein
MKYAQLMEYHFSGAVQLVEDASEPGQEKKLRFKAIVSEADMLNGNRRIYPETVLNEAFTSLNTAIAEGRAAPGLVDHPGWDGASLADIGIKWERFYPMNKTWWGEGTVVPTAKGRDLAAALEALVPVGFSTRGYGESEEITWEDGKPAQRMKALELVTVDGVVNPSVRHARVQSFAKENLEVNVEELQKALEEAVAKHEALVSTNEGHASTIESLNALVESLTARVAALETVEAELRTQIEAQAEQAAEYALTNKLNELTAGHRFAATIISEARELGATIETAEKIVSRLTHLIEAAATASAEQSSQPRGDVSSDEDREEEVDDKLTEAQKDDLRAAGLRPRV